MDKMTVEKQQIFEDLKRFISEIIGEDIVEGLNVTENSRFTKDLEMDSIEIVSFSEKVKVKYGKNINFTSWLSDMDLDQLVDLSLNNVIEYIINANHSNQ